MQTKDQTAILLFSRSSRQEALHKQWVGLRSYQVSRTLLRHVMREARKTGLSICTCFSRRQEGHSFGERLANAAEAVFAQGYTRVLIIGSDSPGLNASLLSEAYHQLQSAPVVLGPSEDGGLYLLGLTATAYDRSLLVDLPWETTYLQEAMTFHLAIAGTGVYVLPSLIDLDTPQHFQDWHPTLVGGRLYAELSRVLAEYHQALQYCGLFVPILLRVLITSSSWRGPPFLIE